MNKLRILYVITKLELGGAQHQLLYTIAHIAQRQRSFEIWLATHNRGFLLSAALGIPGVKVHFIPSLERPINFLKDLKAFVALFRLMKKEKFDIVHTHSSKAGILGRWAAKFAGVPLILHTIHGFAFHNKQNWLTKNLYINLERFTAKITTRLIAVSQEVVRKGLKAGIGQPGQYECVYYGLEKEKFSLTRNRLLIKEHLGFNGRIIGTISCFKPQKALHNFIRAAALIKEEFPEVYFLIIGDGYLRPRLEKLSKKLGLKDNLMFLGWRDDIPELLAAMEIFVLSSFWEGMPIAVLEAMAGGLPVVATAVDGIREIVIPGQTGVLVSSGDYQSLSRGIINLLKNEGLAREMGKRGKDYISRGLFEPKKMVNRTINLYGELISSLKTDKLLC